MLENLTYLRPHTSPTQAGSRQALDQLVRQHLNLVYSAALRQVHDPHLAEDVSQAVFFILAQKAKTIRQGAAVAGWLLVVTRRTAVRAMKRRTLDRRQEEAIAKPELAFPEADSWEQIAPVLDSALNRLPQHERDALALRILEKQSLVQVGMELGISQVRGAGQSGYFRPARWSNRQKNMPLWRKSTQESVILKKNKGHGAFF